MTRKIIVGLGNPGKRYDKTRHNMGFSLLDALAKKWGLGFNQAKWDALVGEGHLGANSILLLKPQTFMNRSGRSIQQAVSFYKLPMEDLLVVLDDVDIHLGSIRLRAKGSAGTHNGLKSVVQELGSDAFPRLKLAVGRRPVEMDMVDFVLAPFGDKERAFIEEEITAGVSCVEDWLSQGVEYAMNRWNSWQAPSLSKMTAEDKKAAAEAEAARKEQDAYRLHKADWCGS